MTSCGRLARAVHEQSSQCGLKMESPFLSIDDDWKKGLATHDLSPAGAFSALLADRVRAGLPQRLPLPAAGMDRSDPDVPVGMASVCLAIFRNSGVVLPAGPLAAPGRGGDRGPERRSRRSETVRS